MIYHMLSASDWQNQDQNEPYVCESLQTDGFIHCTQEMDRLIWVANHFYQRESGDFVILYIDEALVLAEIKWEEADDHVFPHIYGPINCDAIKSSINFPRESNGTFFAPEEWTV